MEKCCGDREMKCLRASCIIWILPILITGLAAGCVSRYDEEQKLRDLDFTVVDREDEPEELSTMIEKEKEHPFQMLYADQGQLYIAEGYGEQPTTGYSVAVRELCETENTVQIRTDLLGPEKGEDIKEITTFPYVVVQLGYIDKDVLFD